MNWMPFVLLFVGLLMIFFEFFLPGGIMGAAGGLLVLLSMIFYGMQTESALYVVIYVAVSLFLVGLLVSFAIWRIKRGKTSGIFLNTEQSGYVASEFDKELVGEPGEALSDLKPAGHILVNKKRYQAVSKTGYIIKGSKIEVVGGEGAHLIVKRKEE